MHNGKESMRIFYIDYENVQAAGLEGIKNLCETDRVLVFHNSTNAIKINVVHEMLSSRYNINFIEIETGTPNALDFQLVAHMFHELNKLARYFIVSKDTGFDAAIKIGKRLGVGNIKRIPNLSSVPKAKKAPIQNIQTMKEAG